MSRRLAWHRLLAVLRGVVAEVPFNVAGLLQSLLDQSLDAGLRRWALDRSDERIPPGLHFRLRWQAGSVNQLLGLDNGILIERGDAFRQGIDKGISSASGSALFT